MNASYKYALVKYLKSWTTWVICAITIVLVIILGGFVPFHFKHITTAADYARTVVILVASVSSFVSLFTSAFAGFKAATMFRDEADDGTLLVMISKPVSRHKLFLAKWFALQTVLLGYTFVVALSFLITILIADTTHVSGTEMANLGIKKIAHNIVPVALLFWVVISIVGIIFSSLSLLMSAKFSVGATIGTSIAIGVAIPATMMVGTFSGKPAYDIATTSETLNNSIALNKSVGNYKFSDKLSDIDKDSSSLYNLGISTGFSDGFKNLQVFDIDYQVKKMSEMASEVVVTKEARDTLDFSKNQFQYRGETAVLDKDNPLHIAEKDVAAFVEMIKNAWELTQGYRNELLLNIFDRIYHSTLTTQGVIDYFMDQDPYYGEVTVDNDHKELFNLSFLAPYIHDKNVDFVQMIKDKNPNIPEVFAYDIGRFFMYRDQMEKLTSDEYSDSIYSIKVLLRKVERLFKNDIEAMPGNQEFFDNEVEGLRNLCEPVNFWVNDQKMRATRLKLSYTFDTETTAFDLKQNTPELDSLGNLREICQSSFIDVKSFYEVTSALKAGHAVVRVKAVEYSNKYTILAIYLGLALLLVPATYLVIRRKDFR